jgi:hypothetical protein
MASFIMPHSFCLFCLNVSIVAINAVDILELDQQLTPYTLTPIRADFRDLNEFKYTSITATDPNLTSAMIPGGLQMNIIGVNSLDEPIQNVWIIVFNNDCGIFPIYIDDEPDVAKRTVLPR